ncbi:family 1 glycosylhydrolase, partial [Microbacterium sp.]|uniref:family 1 glycosylhydrolase n=2 Tax=Microbacterium TaxID=33882 RepID=UPI002615B717
WSIVPSGLGDILRQLRERYPELPPIIITENGASFSDGPGADGRVRDERRIRFLDAHLRALSDEMAAGANVVGYYVWSILDNFEWAAGFSERFGLVHVDLDTLARTPKDSYYWYRDLIEAQNPARSV